MESGTTEKISLSEILNREIGRVAKNFEEYKKKRAEKVPEKKSSSDWFKNLMENLDKVSKSLATADSSKVPEKKDVEIEKVKPASNVSVGEVPITTDDVEKDKLEKYIAFSTAVAVDTFMKNKRIEAAEAEKARIAAEEAEKVRLEAEKARMAAEEAEKARIAAEKEYLAHSIRVDSATAINQILKEDADKKALEEAKRQHKTDAAIKLQSLLRVNQAKKRLEEARKEKEKADEKADDAAIKLQSLYRGKKARAEADQMKLQQEKEKADEEAKKADVMAKKAAIELQIVEKEKLGKDIALSTAVAIRSFMNNQKLAEQERQKQNQEQERYEQESMGREDKNILPITTTHDISKAAITVANAVAIAIQNSVETTLQNSDMYEDDFETDLPVETAIVKDISKAVSIAVAIHANQSKEPMSELYKKESLEPMITVAIANAIKDSVKVDKKKYASIISSIISALLMALLKRRSAIIKQSSETPSEEKEKEKEKEEELEIPKETTTIKDVAVTPESEKIIDDHLHKLCKETFDKKYENMKPGVEAVYTSHDDQYCYGMLFTKEERDGVYVDKSVENVKCPFNKPYEPGANKDEYRVECDKKDKSTPEDKKDDAKNTETDSDKNTENQTGIEKVDSPSDLKPETDIKPTKEFKDQQIAAAIANVVKKGVKRKKSSNVPLRKSPRLQQQAIAISAAIPAN